MMATPRAFSDFQLNPSLLTALAAQGFDTPTPVQAQAIPPAMQGRDVMASAQTGTGKTAAFVLPALHAILKGPSPVKNRGPRVLVLTPTRELAHQVLDNVRAHGKPANIKSGVIYGGVGYGPQYQLLLNPLDLLVATPGRLIDHMGEKKVDFSRIEMVVLDEADKMLDMGFLKPVERILAAVDAAAGRPQMLLFTATLTPAVEKFAQRVLHEPVRVELAPVKVNHSQIAQRAYRADSQNHKLEMLAELLKDPEVGQMIVFSATKYGADKLARKLTQAGTPSAALHGGMKQNARKRTLEQLHQGSLRVLVATDVAARGIDVKQLSHVVNFDLPQVAEDYVHRIGRTGRNGESGTAISLVSPSDVPMLRDIEKMLGRRLDLQAMRGFEPLLDPGEFAKQGAAAPKSRQTPRTPGTGGGAAGQAPRQRAQARPQGQGRPQRHDQRPRGGRPR